MRQSDLDFRNYFLYSTLLDLSYRSGVTCSHVSSLRLVIFLNGTLFETRALRLIRFFTAGSWGETWVAIDSEYYSRLRLERPDSFGWIPIRYAVAIRDLLKKLTHCLSARLSGTVDL